MRKAKLILCFLTLFLATGCWDLNESNTFSIVVGAGIDQLENGEYELTVQIIKPSKSSRGGTSVGVQEMKDFIVLSNKGKTVGEAAEHFLANTPGMFSGDIRKC